MRLKCRKFYRYLFWFLFEVCATNAYILYNDHSGQPKKTLKEFRLELAKGLVGDYHNKKRAGHCPSTPTTLPIRHFPIKLNDGSHRGGALGNLHVHFPTDVLCSGVWEVLKNFQEPELKSLATALQSTVLASRASTTTSKYVYAFLRWKRWAESHKEIVVFPVREIDLALYLQYLGNTTESKSAVEEAVNAVGWVHQLTGYPAVSGSPFVRIVLEGIQRKLAKPKVRKELVTSDMMSAMVNSLGAAPSLTDMRLVAACLLAFSAFLRYDELAKLRCCDITFSHTRMSIHILSSKTDQYRQGDSVLVGRTGSSTCPVAMLERYYSMAALPKQSKLRLFRGIVVTKSGERLLSQGSLSYTRLRELFLGKLSQLGLIRSSLACTVCGLVVHLLRLMRVLGSTVFYRFTCCIACCHTTSLCSHIVLFITGNYICALYV